MPRLTGRDPRTGHPRAVEFANGLITAIGEGPVDETAWLSAGLVDLQVNGFRGYDLNAPGLTANTVIALTHELAKTGVTTYFPTLITQSEARIVAALEAITAARAAHPFVAHSITGIHIEGPHISAEDGYRGAHPREHVRPPSLDEFARWQAAANGLIRLVTLSPHWAEAPAYIAALRAQGVHVSLGHTHAASAEIHAAAAAGADLATHLGNGAADPLPRHPNMIWAQLADDLLTAMFIADGHHLPDDTLRVMLRAKGLDRSILVSDLVALGGLAPGRYETPVGGTVELSTNGRLSLAGTPFLAGAALPLKGGIAHLVSNLNIPLADALTLATTNPGRFAGNRGELTTGAAADLIRFTLDNGKLDIDTTLVGGGSWPSSISL